MAYGGVRGRARHSIGAIVVLGSAFAVGCSGESSSDDDNGASGGGSGKGSVAGAPSGPPVESSGFGQSFADAFCGGVGPCCMREGYPFTESTCVATAQVYMDSLVAKNVSHPGVAFDKDAAGDCIALYRAAAEACTDSTLTASSSNPCRNIFKGTVPEGGHCTDDDECAVIAGVGYVACDAGVCRRSLDDTLTPSDIHGKVGEACRSSCSSDASGSWCTSTLSEASTDSACWRQDGLFCSQTGVCRLLPKVGEPCPDSECVLDAYCDFSTSVSRRCLAATATGPCNSSQDQCLSTSYCDSDTQACTPVKANGALCNRDAECVSANCEGDVCREWSIATSSTCAGILGK